MKESSKVGIVSIIIMALVVTCGFGIVTYAMKQQSITIEKINKQKDLDVTKNTNLNVQSKGEAGAMGPEGAIGPAGPSGKTQTMTTTTDSNSFIADQLFDLGDVTSVYVTVTLQAMNPDGEPLGTSPGQILSDTRTIDCSRDNTFVHKLLLGTWVRDIPYDGSFSLPSITHEMWGVCPRYLKVRLNVMDGDTFNNYTGPKHPTATYKTDVYYK